MHSTSAAMVTVSLWSDGSVLDLGGKKKNPSPHFFESTNWNRIEKMLKKKKKTSAKIRTSNLKGVSLNYSSFSLNVKTKRAKCTAEALSQLYWFPDQ